MKIVINHDLCEANARCVRACPEVFRLDEADKLELVTDAPDESLRAKVLLAVQRCPRAALKLEG